MPDSAPNRLPERATNCMPDRTHESASECATNRATDSVTNCATASATDSATDSAPELALGQGGLASRAPFPWALALFPLLQALCFALAVLAAQGWYLPASAPLAALWLLVASVALSFSIHIFFHECVHARATWPQWFNWLATLWIGLPFDGYRVHHYNHHRFDNAEGDFSSTWRFPQGEPAQARSIWAYTFGWPLQLKHSVRCATPFGPHSERAAQRIKARIPAQKVVLLLTWLLAFLAGWKIGLLYLALIYLGWAWTSLHNYGQHPPQQGAFTSSYASRWYNRVFFNNGLHWEHHHQPRLPWHALKLDPASERIDHAHILNPLFDVFLRGRHDEKTN